VSFTFIPQSVLLCILVSSVVAYWYLKWQNGQLSFLEIRQVQVQIMSKQLDLVLDLLLQSPVEAVRFVCSAAQEINDSLGASNVKTMQLDVAQFSSIRKFVDEFLARDEPLHILINNAGPSLAATWLSLFRAYFLNEETPLVWILLIKVKPEDRASARAAQRLSPVWFYTKMSLIMFLCRHPSPWRMEQVTWEGRPTDAWRVWGELNAAVYACCRHHEAH
jgi:hypothetical protein